MRNKSWLVRYNSGFTHPNVGVQVCEQGNVKPTMTEITIGIRIEG